MTPKRLLQPGSIREEKRVETTALLSGKSWLWAVPEADPSLLVHVLFLMRLFLNPLLQEFSDQSL